MRKTKRRHHLFGVAPIHWLWISAVALMAWQLLQIPSAQRQLAPLQRVSAQTQTTDASNVEFVDADARIYEEVTAAYQQLVEQTGADVSVVFETSDQNLRLAFNESDSMMSASLYKLFVAGRLLEMVDADEVALDQGLIDDHTVSSCLEVMITISDNDCGVALQELIAAHQTTSLLQQRGHTHTSVHGFFPETSAADVALFYQDLLANSYLSNQSSALLLSHLMNQQIDNRLPDQIPGVEIAHKTADLESVSHDAGIIYASTGPYVLVVMTDGAQTHYSSLYDSIAEFSSHVYETVEEYR